MVRVDRLIYGRQQQGQELVNELNRIAAPDALLDQRSVGPLDASFRVVQQAVVRGPAEVRVVWYWYSVAGIETALAQKAKLLELIALGFRRVPSELVSASTVCEDAGCRAGVDRLQAFVSGRAGNQPSPRGS